ncbi:MAG: hypothetical protein ACMVY4_16930 [Minwuia sp.]|uniref:hypothetical protein n=1 Tax=Minwuia sp. TaxID=2493630 RepID=UPI003A87F45F
MPRPEPSLKQPDTALVRLGRVIYWLTSGLAAIGLVLAAVLAVLGTGGNDAWFFAIVLAIAAAVVWGIGRAVRYVLSGY